MSAIVASLLSRTSLFGALGPEDLAACAQSFRARHLGRGQTLFLRGDSDTRLYLVERGLIRLALSSASGRGLSFQVAVAGDLFGEIAALDGGTRTADATAITDVTLHGLDRGAFRELWRSRPDLTACVVTFLCDRLRQMTTQFDAVALLPLETRLARFILSALDPGQPPGRRIPLELGFSQSELSQLLGASRSKVNAALAALEREGAVRRTLDRLFCDPAKLAELAEN